MKIFNCCLAAGSIFLALSSGVANADSFCGKRALQSRDTVTIQLDTPKHGTRAQPAFYLRDTEHSLVLFFKPQDVVAALEKLANGPKPDTRLSQILSAVRADLPLKDNTDLFKYEFHGEGWHGLADNVVATLLDAGHVDIDLNPLHVPGSESSKPSDADDPSAIKRVRWQSGDTNGALYCIDFGRTLLNVVDVN